MGQILAKYRSGKLPKAFKVIPSLTNWEDVSVKLVDFLVPANFSEHTGSDRAGKILISWGVPVNFTLGQVRVEVNWPFGQVQLHVAFRYTLRV